MTNKVKPFYIRITDDMTPQMVQGAFDKCVDAGVEVVGNIHDWNYVGLRENGIVHFSMFEACFHGIEEITLDQLDKWLGLEAEQEWKNGDECIWLENNQEFKFVSLHCENKKIAIVWNGANDYRHCNLSDLRKPETPEQKAKRERLEAVEEITEFLNSLSPHCKEKMEYVARAIVDKTKYRKQ